MATDNAFWPTLAGWNWHGVRPTTAVDLNSSNGVRPEQNRPRRECFSWAINKLSLKSVSVEMHQNIGCRNDASFFPSPKELCTVNYCNNHMISESGGPDALMVCNKHNRVYFFFQISKSDLKLLIFYCDNNNLLDYICRIKSIIVTKMSFWKSYLFLVQIFFEQPIDWCFERSNS